MKLGIFVAQMVAAASQLLAFTWLWFWFAVPLGMPSITAKHAVGLLFLAEVVSRPDLSADDEERLGKYVVRATSCLSCLLIGWLLS